MAMSYKNLPDDKMALHFLIQRLEVMGDHSVNLEGLLRPLPHVEFIWLKKGSGSLTVDFQEYLFSENVIYCLSPGQFRTIKAESRLEGYYMILSPDLYFNVKGEFDCFFLSGRFARGRNITLLMPAAER